MIDGSKPYPAYKDSGVPWLGAVPAHWDMWCRFAISLASGMDRRPHVAEQTIGLKAASCG